MAREWWQYSNWPDGRSGANPSLTNQDPNAVEIWPAGTMPNLCTVFRKSFLNQFLSWKYYLLNQPITSSTYWLKSRVDENENAYVVPTLYGSGWQQWCGLQNARFWEWLATMDNRNPTRHSLPPQTSPTSAPVDFASNTAFYPKYEERVEDGEVYDFEGSLPDAATLPDFSLINQPPWFTAYANLEWSGLHDLQFNLAKLLYIIRAHYDVLGVYDANWYDLVVFGGLRNRVHIWEGQYDELNNYIEGSGKYVWHEHSHSQSPSRPYPSYAPNGGSMWDDHVLASWPYPPWYDMENERHPLYNGPDSAGAWTHTTTSDGVTRGTAAGIYYITGVDAFKLSDTNYKYAIYSIGPAQSGGGGYHMPSEHGYCHAVFELERDIDLENPPSHMVHVTGLGNGNYNFVQRDSDLWIHRDVGLAAFPYSRVPDSFKSPDWPLDGTTYYLPLDRQNRWLLDHPDYEGN